MSYNVREMLKDFTNGLEKVGGKYPNQVKGFMGLLKATSEPGALSVKDKELISIGISAYARCEYCIVYHVYKAFESGATSDEIMEAALVSVTFGGGPSMAYIGTLLTEAVAEFGKDFEKQ